MKKFVYISLSGLALLLFSACGQKNDSNENTLPSSSSSEAVVENKEEQAKNSAKIVLDAMLNGNTSKFKKVTGKDYSSFIDEMVQEFIDEKVDDYKPEADWSLELKDGSVLTPTDILTNFKETQLCLVLQAIKEYEIKDVEIKGSEATITFSAHGVSLKDVSNAITLIRTNVFEDGLGGSLAAQESKDTEVIKANTLLDYYLYWAAFSEAKVDVGVMDEEQEFILTLTEKEGSYTFSTKQFLNLAKELMVNKYSDENS